MWCASSARARVPATVTLKDRSGADTLSVGAGAGGTPDPGDWGNALSVEIEDNPRGSARLPAQIVGTKTEPFAVPAEVTVTAQVRGVSTPVKLTFPASDFASPRRRPPRR